MKFALLITAAPFSAQGAESALRFARSAIDGGHSIERIFFFRDGVHNASQFVIAPQDEVNIPQSWQVFCSEQSIDAVVCVSAAIKRGLVDALESQRHHLAGSNIAPAMQVAGLGLLTDAIINADRVVTFG